MDGKKMRNPHVWLRMAGELAALETLASQILCDREYNEVMDKKPCRHKSGKLYNPLWPAVVLWKRPG